MKVTLFSLFEGEGSLREERIFIRASIIIVSVRRDGMTKKKHFHEGGEGGDKKSRLSIYILVQDVNRLQVVSKI